jgi:diguanylate cyclase (GGDEF)-like protein
VTEAPARLAASGAIPREERQLAGIIGGGLYLLAGATVSLFNLVPGIPHGNWVLLLGVGAVGTAWGALSLLRIDWLRVPNWVFHASTVVALGATAGVLSWSGGGASPAWVDLFFIATFVAYFYRPPLTWIYLLACVLVHASILLYDRHALREAALAQLVIAGPAYLALGAAILAGKRRITRLRERSERLAAEQGALRRVATAVVSGAPAAQIYELVARETAQLLGADAAGILRRSDVESMVVTGSWGGPGQRSYPPGTEVPIRPGSDLEESLRTQRPVRIGYHPDGSPVELLGCRSSLIAPIPVAERIWGVLAASARPTHHFSAEDERQLVEFGDLLATAITSLEDRARLAAQALTDPLTGLANHRALQERLRSEVSRAGRHGGSLSVAVIDIDHFKQINDTGGHELGDEMLVEISGCLARLARAEDTLGRLGGDEFAWLLPETTREQALVAVERARRMIAATLRRPFRITVSAGICDTSVTDDPAALVSFADAALYWSKAQGRNRTWIYDPEVIGELSAGERAARLQRSQALFGLRALARAIDAKDAGMKRHSERVSELVRKLALSAGWSVERAQLLSEAALVHDVGKVGVPDSVLHKRARLTPEERAQIQTHAELSARIVEDVLTPEQVFWVRTHHERPDGAGYPRGLAEEDIPEGGALLALADSWDAMTAGRSYSPCKDPEAAIVECIELIGRQFTETAVSALTRVHASGELTGDLVRLGPERTAVSGCARLPEWTLRSPVRPPP